MNRANGVSSGLHCWRNGLVILAAAYVLVGAAVAEEKPVEKPVEGTSSEVGKAVPRISPHVLAAQRRALEEDEAAPARAGLQSQMHKQAVRHHLSPTRFGT